MEEEKSKQPQDSVNESTKTPVSEQSQIRKIKIKTLNNTVYPIEVPCEILIKDLKVEIEKATQVPIARQRLVCMGKLMQDKDPLTTYVKEDDSCIHLMAKIDQPANTQPNQSAPQQQQQQQQQQPNQQRQPFRINMGNPNVVFTQVSSSNPNEINQIFNSVSNLISAVSQNNNNQAVNLQQQPLPQQQPQTQQQQQQQPAQPTQQTQQQQQSRQINQNQATSEQQRRILTINRNNANNQNSNNPGSEQQQSQPLPQPQPQPQVIQQRQVLLPHNQLYNLGQISNNLMGLNSQFPGPPMPLTQNRNGLQLMGSYLANYQFQISRILPFMYRLSELLQRENLMNDRNHRIETERLSHDISKALEEIVHATQPVIGLFKDVQIGDRPGEFKIFDRQSNQPYEPVQIAQYSTNPLQQFNMSQLFTTQNANIFTQSTQSNNQTQQQQQQPTPQVQQQQHSTTVQAQQQQQQQQPQQQQQQQQIPINQPRAESTITISMQGLGIEQGNDGAMTVVGIDSSNNPGNLNLQGILQNFIGNLMQDEDDSMTENSLSNSSNIQQQQPPQPQTINLSPQMTVPNNQQNQTSSQQPQQQQQDQSQKNENQANSAQQQQTNQQPQMQIPLDLINMLNQNFRNQNNQPQQQQQQQPPQQQQQQQQQQQVSSSQQQQQQNPINIFASANLGQQQQQQSPQFNPLALFSMLGNAGGEGGQPGGGLSDIMNMSIKQLMEQNSTEQQTEEDKLFLEIFGQTKVSDVVTAFITSNFSFLDNIHASIQESLEEQIKKKGSTQILAESFANDFHKFFCPKQNQQNLILEGFDPDQVSREILIDNFLKIFAVIQQQYLPEPEGDTKFSIELVKTLKQMLGQVIYEVSEGLVDGIASFEIVFKGNIQSLLENHVGQQLAGLASMFLLDNLWQSLKKQYLEYKSKIEESNKQQNVSEEQKQNNQEQEQQLLQQINQQAEKDKEQFEKYKETKLSDQYKKGDINYQGD